jgi:Uma2 family endonuclease
MSVATDPVKRRLMTAEEFLALPDDGTDRELIQGVLRERPTTFRNRHHSRVETRTAKILDNWLDTQREPRGIVHSGEAGFRLRREPDTVVGIDVAYASAELVASTDAKATIYDGPPVLAVEILSPSDQSSDIADKIDNYLEVGTVVWVVDPRFRTVVVYRPGREPEMFNATQEISGEPELPGFRVPVADFFS